MAAVKHFLPEIKARIGKCISHSVKDEHIEYAAKISKRISEQWKYIVAGEHGYLTTDSYPDQVRWGEMVSTNTVAGMEGRCRGLKPQRSQKLD